MNDDASGIPWKARAEEFRQRAARAATDSEKRKWLVLAESCEHMVQLLGGAKKPPPS